MREFVMDYRLECLTALSALVVSLGFYLITYLSEAIPDPGVPLLFAGAPILLAGIRSGKLAYRLNWSSAFISVHRQQKLMKRAGISIRTSLAWSLGFIAGSMLFSLTLRGHELLLEDARYFEATFHECLQYSLPPFLFGFVFMQLAKFRKPHP